jgi:hypothetical protein
MKENFKTEMKTEYVEMKMFVQDVCSSLDVCPGKKGISF